MKKFLLSLAVLALGATYASAEEVTITIKGADTLFGSTTSSDIDKNGDFTFTNQGFTFKTTKGSTTPSAYNKAGDLRLYAGATFTITAPGNATLDKVVFNISTQGKKRLAPVTANVGTIATQDKDDETVTWTGSSASVIYTVGATSDYGSESGKAGQLDFDSIVITYTLTGEAKEAANLKFDGTSFTATMGKAFTAPTLSKDTDAAIAYTSGNPEVATVDAATGAVTLVAPGTTVITAKAEETEKFYADEASYTLTVLAADVVYYNTCFTDDCGFTSIYADGSFNPWSITSQYGLKASAFQNSKANASDAIMASPVIDLTNRVNSSVEFDHALNQFKLNGTMLESVDGALEYVSVVAREEGATEWTKLSNPVLPATYTWDFINSGVIDLSAFDGKKMQLGFRYISTEEIAGTWEIKNVQIKGTDKSVGVVENLVDQNDAPAVYYNLQGVRVANPENGLYIKVQGNKSTKVVIR